jgi:hypothetical protein
LTRAEIQAPWQLRRFVQNQVIPVLNLQRNDLSTDQFAAVILSDNNQINTLRLSKGIIIKIFNVFIMLYAPINVLPQVPPVGKGGGFDQYEINCLSPGAN